jgi:hypothetical protein
VPVQTINLLPAEAAFTAAWIVAKLGQWVFGEKDFSRRLFALDIPNRYLFKRESGVKSAHYS